MKAKNEKQEFIERVDPNKKVILFEHIYDTIGRYF